MLMESRNRNGTGRKVITQMKKQQTNLQSLLNNENLKKDELM